MGIAAAMFINNAAPLCFGQEVEFSYGPVTENTVLIPIESTEYLVQASSSVGGTVQVNGDKLEDWIEEGSNVTLMASANENYNFVGWSGLPDNLDTNSSFCCFSVNDVYTNILANFVPKRTITNDVSLSISPDLNQINLEILSTYSSRVYHIYGSTNLLNDSANSWIEKTNKVGTGSQTSSNLIFNLPMENLQEFFRAKETYQE